MIKQEDIDQFNRDGFIHLPGIVPDDYQQTALEIGSEIYPVHQSKRRQPKDFGSSVYWPIMDMYSTKNSQLYELMTSDFMAQVVTSFLGPTTYLFNEQFVFKPAGDAYSVRWHTDNSCTAEHQDGLDGKYRAITTVWFLSQHDAESGGIHYLPSRFDAGIEQDDYSNELKAVIAQPGDMAIWDGNLYHFSGPNVSTRDRFLWLQVYSTRPMKGNRYQKLFTKDGVKV